MAGVNDDLLIGRIRVRAKETTGSLRPVATLTEVESAEARLGTRLPELYRRLLLEVANGGFGPGYGLFGIPPSGAFDPDLPANDVIQLYEADRLTEGAPRGILHLCSWGCGKWSHLDLEDPEGAVLTSEWLEDGPDGPGGLSYWRTCPSLRAWLNEWTDAAIPSADLTVNVIGSQTRVSPFTGAPQAYPITEPRGPLVRFDSRK